jgi:YfiR/HmsC-like
VQRAGSGETPRARPFRQLAFLAQRARTAVAHPALVCGRYFFICLTLLSFVAPMAWGQLHDERAVKAAFVFNLTKYVEWPQTTNEMVIGFLGEAQTGEIFQKMLDGKSSGSRTIHVLLSPSDQDLARCSILYIADLSAKRIRAALDQVHGKGVLTVGDTELFVRAGGMIGLITVGERVQIDVSLEVAQESKLKISSKLLSIATLVRPGAEAKN